MKLHPNIIIAIITGIFSIIVALIYVLLDQSDFPEETTQSTSGTGSPIINNVNGNININEESNN